MKCEERKSKITQMTTQDSEIKKKSIYVAGSLRNIPAIQDFCTKMRYNLLLHNLHTTFEVVDDWTAHGPTPDLEFISYAKMRGWTTVEALASRTAQAVFNIDIAYLDQASCVIMLQPSGKSAALELGYSRGRGKKTVIVKNCGQDQITEIEIMENMAHLIASCESSFFDNFNLFVKLLESA
jgi:hypothetical protein